MVKSMGLGTRHPSSTPGSCVTFGKSYDRFVPQFFYYKIRGFIIIIARIEFP